MSSFFYGNPCQAQPNKPKIIPLLASQLSPHISFKDSTYYLQADKSATAREALFHESGNSYIYTFEASFFGYVGQQGEKQHFSISDFKSLGKSIGQTLYKIALAEVDYIPSSILQQQQKLVVDKALEQVYRELELNPNCFASSNANAEESSGSESEPQIDELNRKEIQSIQNPQARTAAFSFRMSSSPSKCPHCLRKLGKGEACHHNSACHGAGRGRVCVPRADAQTQTEVDQSVFQCLQKLQAQFQDKPVH